MEIPLNDVHLTLVVLSIKHLGRIYLFFIFHLLPSSVCYQLMTSFQILTDIAKTIFDNDFKYVFWNKNFSQHVKSEFLVHFPVRNNESNNFRFMHKSDWFYKLRLMPLWFMTKNRLIESLICSLYVFDSIKESVNRIHSSQSRFSPLMMPSMYCKYIPNPVTTYLNPSTNSSYISFDLFSCIEM